MKIKFLNNLLIVYLYNKKLNLSNKVEVTKDIKKILENLINYYKYDISGMYKTTIYENKYYGAILEIEKIKDFEYGDFIDIKLDIKYEIDFYLTSDNYNYLEKFNNVFYNNNNYFVNICELENVNIIFEYGDILYKDYDELLNSCVNIVKKNVN